jgi:tRNA(Ile)-lysidine synthase
MHARIARTALPVCAAECDDRFACLTGQRLLLAVSGGPDSIAMMGLVAEWARRHAQQAPAVAVVDHGLRDGSADEARSVLDAAASLGLGAAALRWTGAKPVTGLQAAARAARYRLLADHAAALGATTLLTAHTLDDQAETVLMRLSRGSGLTGLSGMERLGRTRGLSHVRPLLDLAKDRLVATCLHHGWRFSADPSNQDPRFARARWRAIMPVLARQGLDAGRLAIFARRMAEADAALRLMTQDALQECRIDTLTCLWRLDAGKLFANPVAVQIRVLDELVSAADDTSDNQSRPELRLQRIEACAMAFRAALSERAALRRSLGRQILTLTTGAILSAQPEASRRRGASTLLSDSALARGRQRTT